MSYHSVRCSIVGDLFVVYFETSKIVTTFMTRLCSCCCICDLCCCSDITVAVAFAPLLSSLLRLLRTMMVWLSLYCCRRPRCRPVWWRCCHFHHCCCFRWCGCHVIAVTPCYIVVTTVAIAPVYLRWQSGAWAPLYRLSFHCLEPDEVSRRIIILLLSSQRTAQQNRRTTAEVC